MTEAEFARPAILTVDDDASVSRMVARDLRRQYGDAYRIVRAESGEQALEALRETGRGVFYGSALTEVTSCAGHDVFIVGGANSAGQAAVHFARVARSVTMLVRGPSLQASMSSYLLVRDNRGFIVAGPYLVVASGSGCRCIRPTRVPEAPGLSFETGA